MYNGSEGILGPRAHLRSQYRFTLSRSQKAYRLNRFLIEMAQASVPWDREEAMHRHMLSEMERSLLSRHDFEGLLDYGVSVILLANSATALGMSFLEMGLMQRGQTMQEFLTTKRCHAKGQAWRK